MKTLQWPFLIAVVASLVQPSRADTAIIPIEPTMLGPLVAAGKLPPVAQRQPATPMIADMSPKWRLMGRHGGSLRLLMGRSKDIRMLVVHG